MCRWSFILILFFFVSGCEFFKHNEKELTLEDERKHEKITLSSNPKKGKIIYFTNCVPCHNNDPTKQGTIGPKIYSASKDLLLTKLNYGEYPKNYTPKRSTKIMPMMPHLHKEISNLHAFLNEPK